MKLRSPPLIGICLLAGLMWVNWCGQANGAEAEPSKSEAKSKHTTKAATSLNTTTVSSSITATLGQFFRDCPKCPDMAVIPAGSFEMGSDDGDSEEIPVHRVTITRSFAIGKTEVTQGQWRAVMGSIPAEFRSKDCGDNCPVETVSWEDAQDFIQKLNAMTGKQYRLPSEAEWEYACRAGGRHKYCGSDKINNVAWYWGNSDSSVHPVSRKQPNAFDLYDMSGNVWEWVEDSDHDSYVGAPTDGSAWQGNGSMHVLRGGSWDMDPWVTRAVKRFRFEPALRVKGVGFRIARILT